jgi:hypothetical protein
MSDGAHVSQARGRHIRAETAAPDVDGPGTAASAPGAAGRAPEVAISLVLPSDCTTCYKATTTPSNATMSGFCSLKSASLLGDVGKNNMTGSEMCDVLC